MVLCESIWNLSNINIQVILIFIMYFVSNQRLSLLITYYLKICEYLIINVYYIYYVHYKTYPVKLRRWVARNVRTSQA